MMDEFELINKLKQRTYNQSAVQKGIGDDAAIFHQPNQEIVIAKDMFVENIHFSKQSMDPFYIGYRGLAANCSDLAAMGASPAFYLVGITVPDRWTTGDVQAIYKGMEALAKPNKMDLIGGDTTSGKELVLSITVIGFVDERKVRYRSLAKDGDIVFVTGTLGDSQAGFHMLSHPYDDYVDATYYMNRHRMPSPRVEFANALGNIARVSLNDISDGLASEANEIAEASKVDILIDERNIPVHESFSQFPEEIQKKWKYFGGEDFELLGTISKLDLPELKKAAERTSTKITIIGHVINNDTDSDKGKVYVQLDNQRILLKKEGYNHLSR